MPGCNIVLGDRPVGITLKRAINSLSTWKRIRLVWSLLTSKEKISFVLFRFVFFVLHIVFH